MQTHSICSLVLLKHCLCAGELSPAVASEEHLMLANASARDIRARHLRQSECGDGADGEHHASDELRDAVERRPTGAATSKVGTLKEGKEQGGGREGGKDRS